ncbi:cobalt-precorrin 5A hydrolase [Sagittula marina]|uniref:Cobalt-precorrin 5A hydrolase n=1 Tax=Sagittula marina TaxID=943940 RepID=A0A7W6DT57_9RHOB|nr:cobalamin biosynthesis protein [Sagittula marina]MBB3987251.1 cobalt-precorrin 5A hydrolase [Sagittula marina]
MIVAGFGFSTRAQTDSLRDAFNAACAAVDRPPQMLATAADKAASLAPLADELGLPLVSVTAEDLVAQPTFTQSLRVAAERGTGSVAEAAALAAAGPGARLLAPRLHAADRLSSCALAEGAPL